MSRGLIEKMYEKSSKIKHFLLLKLSIDHIWKLKESKNNK